jgi:hypothetical protein
MKSYYKPDYITPEDHARILRSLLIGYSTKIAAKRTFGSLLPSKDLNIMTQVLLKTQAGKVEEIESFEGLTTRTITVAEHGGSGKYYFVKGYHRKAGNTVKFAAIPTEGEFLFSVFMNGVRIYEESENVYAFIMPDEDVTIDLTYSENPAILEGIGYWFIEDDFIVQ